MLLDARIIVLLVHDLQKAGDWYAGVLHFAPYHATDREICFNGGGYDLRLVRARRRRSTATVPAVYWRVNDLAAALRRFRQAGAIQRSTVETFGPVGLLATVEDPFGNLIGLAQEANVASSIQMPTSSESGSCG